MNPLLPARRARRFFAISFLSIVFSFSSFAQCGWQQGDFETYTQNSWGDASEEGGMLLGTPHPSLAVSLFSAEYSGSGLIVGGPFPSFPTMTFTSISSVITFLPAGGTTGVLNGSLSNPLSSSAGRFGGEVVALKLNVDFSDNKYMNGSSPVPFGDLIITGLSSVAPAVEGMTVREFLDLANLVLGGNSTPIGPGLTDAIASSINNAFVNGTPSQFAQDHLRKNWQQGDMLTYSQSGYSDEGSAGRTLLVQNEHVVYPIGISVGRPFVMHFTDAVGVISYLPANGPAGSLTSNSINPVSTSAGELGGEVLTLKMNVDFSDAKLLPGIEPLGSLVIHDFDALSMLNGLTVREFLHVANSLLGGDYSSGLSEAQAAAVARYINLSFVNGAPSEFAINYLRRPARIGALRTYTQTDWGNASSDAGTLLSTQFLKMYGGNNLNGDLGFFAVGGNFIAAFYTATDVHNFLPQLSPAGVLTGSAANPTTTPAGELAGELTALLLNLDFSDANLLPGTTPLGNYVFHDYADFAVLNGQTVRQFLSSANILLGGGSASFTTTEAATIARLINEAFVDGTRSQFAQDHLSVPACNHCPTTSSSSITILPDKQVFLDLQASDGDGDLLTLSITQDPKNGTLFIDGDGGVYYTPNTGYLGRDTVVFKASDGTCDAEDTIYIKVECPSIMDLGMVTYTQTDWGDASSAAGALLINNFTNVFQGSLEIGGTNSIALTSAFGVFNFLPAIGLAGTLSASIQNPLTTSAGELAGEVAALAINIAFSDANVLPGATPLGDLVIHDFEFVPDVNGQTVRQFLAIANHLLGGGGGVPFGASTAAAIARNINAAFTDGTPGGMAIYLQYPCPDAPPCEDVTTWQQDDLITYTQTVVGTSGTDVILLLQQFFNALYPNDLSVGTPNKLTLTETGGLISLLPTSGSSGSLSGSLVDPQTTSAGELAGEVVALKVNVDLSDIDLLPNSPPLGDLVFHNITTEPTLNGMSIRDFLTIAQNVLGGTANQPYGSSTTAAVARLVNAAFVSGTPSTFAQNNLRYFCEPVPVNYCPVTSSSNIATPVGTAINAELQATDEDGDALVYTVHQSAAHGTVTIADSIATYTPTSNYSGSDYFVFNVNDGECDEQDTVYITVVVCPEGQGHWKNNPNAWPASATPMLLGTRSYTKAQLITILKTSIGSGKKADASLILAHALIAAKLSVAAGTATSQALLDSIAAADALIGSNTIPMKVEPSSVLGKRMTKLAGFLSDFLSGSSTVGCGATVGPVSGKKENVVQEEATPLLLLQNFPNPFSDVTYIGYSIPEDRYVHLAVYNLIGERVAVLYDGMQQAGNRFVEFDARTLRSGVYFCRMESGDFKAVRKMLVVK